MHVARANLDFEQLTSGAEHGGVQRLVAVRLWLRDVVLDPLLDRRPPVVDHAQCVVALEDVGHDDANSEQVVDVLIRAVALLHLLVDRPQVLGPPRHFDVGNTRVGEALLQRLPHLRDEVFPLAPLGRHHLRERLVGFRFEVLERQILQLPAHFGHAEAMRERCIQIARLLRDSAALFGGEPVQRTHVVQPIRQLDQDDPRILGDGQQQLAVVLDLAFLPRGERQVGDFGEPIDDLRDLGTELAFDIVDGNVGVFHNVVQQPAGNRGGIQMQVGENACNLHAMGDIRLTRMAHLTGMRGIGEPIRAYE